MARPAIAPVLLATWLATAAAEPNWVALFLSPEEQEALCAKLLVPGVPSAADPHCQHLTIAYNPPNMPLYSPHFGQRVRIQPLAVGRDGHGQALLCRVANASLRSTNSFPHVTISDAGAPPYTAVYSNTLWTRLSRPFGPLSVSHGAREAAAPRSPKRTPPSHAQARAPSAHARVGRLPRKRLPRPGRPELARAAGFSHTGKHYLRSHGGAGAPSPGFSRPDRHRMRGQPLERNSRHMRRGVIRAVEPGQAGEVEREAPHRKRGKTGPTGAVATGPGH